MENQQKPATKLWFKRKEYGWGWYPVTKEGWLVVAAYIILVFAAMLTLDRNSPPSETWFTGLLPLVLLTAALLRICYAKGEKPKWQWGRKDEDENK